MNVVHIVPSIAEEASGPSYSVPRLAQTLAERGIQVDLHVLAPAPAARRAYRLHCHPRFPALRRLGISPPMRSALRGAAVHANILHNHSLWMMPNIYPAWAVRGTACRLVTSPRGTLSSWALRRSRWAKRAMWLLGQARAVRASHCFHATCEAEYAEIRALGLLAPVAVIPNGIDIPEETSHPVAQNGRRRLLFLSRIHPIKGVDILLRSWQRVQARYPDWELRLVGPDEGRYLSEIQELAQDLGVERVTIAGPVYGPEKEAEFRRADLFVLPSHSENFGMAVAEALAHGVPAIVTKGAPWAGLENHRAGWWIDQGVHSVTDCLASVLQLKHSELDARGRNGRRWMEEEYSWHRVGQRMHDTYLWLLGCGPRPDCVRQ